MKRSKKSSLLILGIITLLVIEVLRETGIITLEYYTFDSNTNTNANWSNNSTTIGMPLAGFHTKFTDLKHADIPIVVLYQNDTLYYKKGHGKPVEIKIQQINTGVLWMPLYKSTGVSVNVHVNYTGNSTKATEQVINVDGKPEPAIYQSDVHITGNISVNGYFTFKGICSHRRALHIIKDKVAESIASQAGDYFSKLD